MDTETIIAKGRQCLDIEIEALEATKASMGQSFATIVVLLRETIENKRKLIFSGIGKNAHICEKLVGTFNSIGAPSCFLDPVRALHGDVGLCQEGDTMLAFSNKGETAELVRLVPYVSRFNLRTIAVTSKTDSSLAKQCDHILPYSVEKEACPLDLAPTASTTAGMAIGDAVAMVLLEWREIGKEGFAQYHPAGTIGRQLAPQVDEIMRGSGNFAMLPASSTCKECLVRMTNPNSGCIALTDGSGKLEGIFTDGDIRRLTLLEPEFLEKNVSEYMTRNPVSIRSGSLVAEALKILETHRIDDLIVVDEDNRPIGVIDGQDLTKVRAI